MSSAHSKIIELCLTPCGQVESTQFGFTKHRDTTMACAYLHDVISYFHSSKSPLHLCSLDAEKRFDSIWHPGLFCKLIDVLPAS